ncbi:MAG: hypothetical protein RLZZ507_3539 [Cyanobacteriota bacterium]|jgi:hypothetical protein
MKRPFLPVHKILVATFAGISFASFLVAQPSLADLSQVDNRPGFDSTNTDPCFGGSDGSFSLFNVIHCANLKPGNLGNTGLDTEAEEFKRKQNQQLQGQNPQSDPSVPGSQPLGNIPLEIKLPSATPTGN